MTDINANFALAAPLASPTFTGTPTLPTGTIAVTQSPGDNSTKVATTAFVTAAAAPLTIETGTSATQSLTTTASQKVIVWAKGNVDSSFVNGNPTVLLKYNNVTKDTVEVSTPAGNAATGKIPFALMYTETPGATTHDITVTSGNTLANISIIVMKIG